MLSAIGSVLLDFVYPRSCQGCGRPVGDRTGHVCWDCMAALEWVAAPMCRICGDPVYGSVGHEYGCSACAKSRPWFGQARSAARYRGPLQTMMQAFKYGDGICLTNDFAQMLLACVRTHWPRTRFDAVAAVPLHPRKQRERTYNQSGLLARTLARRMETLDMSRVLRRVKPTISQTGLSASQRQANVRNAFDTCHADWIEERAFLLVDDVMTTGATVNACARELKKAGARDVHVVTVARG